MTMQQTNGAHVTRKCVFQLLQAVTKILGLTILGLTMAITLGLCQAQGAAADRPNVIIILADDLGFSDLGCYGSEIATPHLDQLAANGLQFTQFYNTGRCWPTRAAVMTGYYAQQVRRDAMPGIRGGARAVRPPWARLLPEMLAPLGYRSYHSGKWHIDGPRLPAGFVHSYSLEDHDRFFYPKHHLLDDVALPAVEPDAGYYATSYIAEHAIQCLQEHAESHADQPFFHYLCFTSPHFPLHAPAEDIAKYAERYHSGWNALRAERWQRIQDKHLVSGTLSEVEPDIGPPYDFPKAFEQLGAGEINRPFPWDSLTPEQQEFQAAKMAVHAAMVDHMDQAIGRVLKQLETMNQLDQTLIFFLSDNGASAEIMVRGDGHDQAAPAGSGGTFLCLGPGWSNAANTPFRRHKTWVHEGGIATPLIVHWPAGISARGQLRQTPGHVIDLVPTVLEAAGGSVPKEWDGVAVPTPPGRSLVPAFAEDVVIPRDHLWWLHEGNRAIRVGSWKLVAAKGEAWQLYDLSVDRAETNDVSAAHPERVVAMERLWQAQLEACQALAEPEPEASE